MNDPTANWSAWLAEHSPKLMLFARTQTRSEADAEDVLQEAKDRLAEWQQKEGQMRESIEYLSDA